MLLEHPAEIVDVGALNDPAHIGDGVFSGLQQHFGFFYPQTVSVSDRGDPFQLMEQSAEGTYADGAHLRQVFHGEVGKEIIFQVQYAGINDLVGRSDGEGQGTVLCPVAHKCLVNAEHSDILRTFWLWTQNRPLSYIIHHR